MDSIQQLTSLWLEWQFRALLFSALVLLVAAPSHWRSPVWRHWVLVSGALVLILFPVLPAMLPEWDIPMIPTELRIDPYSAPIQLHYEREGQSFWGATLLVLSAIAALVIAHRYFRARKKYSYRLAQRLTPEVDLLQLFERCKQEVGVANREIQLVVDQSNHAPCTSGWLNPTVVLPANADGWESEDTRIVLIHELQHIKRLDWLWQQCLVALVVLYPLNPFAWKIKTSARALAEESVDKQSLSLNIPPMKYANTLLRQLRACQQIRSSVAVHMHQRLDIVDRVSSLISEPYSWPNMKRASRGQISILIMLLAVPVLGVQPVALPIESWVWEQIPTITEEDEPNIPNVQIVPGDTWPSAAVPISDPEYPPVKPTLLLTSIEVQPTEVDVPLMHTSTAVSRHEIPIEPRPLYLAQPSYPNIALRRGWEATVRVAFDLDDQGQVVNARITSASSLGSAQFEQAALGAIEASMYQVQDPSGQTFIKQNLTQTYVFELIEDERLSSSVNERRNPP